MWPGARYAAVIHPPRHSESTKSLVIRRRALTAQSGDCGTEMRGGIVPEFHDARMAFEGRLDDAALHTAAAAVNQSHVENAGVRRRVDVIGHDGGDVTWREGVQIDLGSDRDPERQKLICL